MAISFWSWRFQTRTYFYECCWFALYVLAYLIYSSFHSFHMSIAVRMLSILKCVSIHSTLPPNRRFSLFRGGRYFMLAISKTPYLLCKINISSNLFHNFTVLFGLFWTYQYNGMNHLCTNKIMNFKSLVPFFFFFFCFCSSILKEKIHSYIIIDLLNILLITQFDIQLG